MKYALVTLSMLTLGLVSCSDDDGTDNDVAENEVPSVVSNTFQQEFPNATDVEWETVGADYEADFEVETVDYSALISAEGAVAKYKYDIAAASLPEAVTEKIVAEYENKRVDDSETLVIDAVTYYQVELDDEPEDQQVIFNEDGTVNVDVLYYE